MITLERLDVDGKVMFEKQYPKLTAKHLLTVYPLTWREKVAKPKKKKDESDK